MSGLDPGFITQADWKSVSLLIVPLWTIAGSALGLAGSMLLAHGMIPSLAASRDIPQRAAGRARPPLYAAAAVFLALGLYGVLIMVDRLDVISTIFYRGAV